MTQAKGIGSMADVRNSIKQEFRNYLDLKFEESDQFSPDLDATELPTLGDIKNWANNGRTACFRLMKGARTGKPHLQPPLPAVQEKLEKVATRFYFVATRTEEGLEKAREAVDAFNTWKDTEGYLCWETFVQLQSPVAELAKGVVEGQAKMKVYADCSNRAKAIAVAERKKHMPGPNDKVGTVIAGLVDSVSNGEWVGTSGHGKSHPVMDELLSGVMEAEEWPVRACGEVDAMIQYLTARNITEVKQIPLGALFSHAETWVENTGNPKDRANTGKWVGRAACHNCAQWLDKIKANRA